MVKLEKSLLEKLGYFAKIRAERVHVNLEKLRDPDTLLAEAGDLITDFKMYNFLEGPCWAAVEIKIRFLDEEKEAIEVEIDKRLYSLNGF
jgi:hypothetical protein